MNLFTEVFVVARDISGTFDFREKQYHATTGAVKTVKGVKQRRTFKMKEKSALRETRLSSSERDCHVVTWSINVDNLTSQRSAVTEERPVSRGYFQVVVATTSAFYVQFKVQQGDADCLATLDMDRPAALCIHVVLIWIVWTSDVTTVVQRYRLSLWTATL